MSLSDKQRKQLRRLGHALHPLVTIGNAGLTEGVIGEMDRALADHELIKVRARLDDRAARDAAFATLGARTRALLVQRIGNVGLYFRPNPRLSKIVLPD